MTKNKSIFIVLMLVALLFFFGIELRAEEIKADANSPILGENTENKESENMSKGVESDFIDETEDGTKNVNDEMVDNTSVGNVVNEDGIAENQISVTVDKLNKDQKKLKQALEPTKYVADIVDADYNENGFYAYKDAFIIDFLPDIFVVKDGSKIEIAIDQNALKANGANKDMNFDEFKNNIEYLYVEDIDQYLRDLESKNPTHAAVLKIHLKEEDKLIPSKQYSLGCQSLKHHMDLRICSH